MLMEKQYIHFFLITYTNNIGFATEHYKIFKKILISLEAGEIAQWLGVYILLFHSCRRS